MFNSFYIPKTTFKTIANCIDNYDLEECHLLQANISHIGFHERFYSSFLLVLDTPFFNESVQKQNVFQQKTTSFAFKFTPTTLSNTQNARPQIRGSPQLPVTVSNYRVCVFGYDDSIQPRQVDTKKT